MKMYKKYNLLVRFFGSETTVSASLLCDTPLRAADSAQIRALLFLHFSLQALARKNGLVEECLCCWFCRCNYRDRNVS